MVPFPYEAFKRCFLSQKDATSVTLMSHHQLCYSTLNGHVAGWHLVSSIIIIQIYLFCRICPQVFHVERQLCLRIFWSSRQVTRMLLEMPSSSFSSPFFASLQFLLKAVFGCAEKREVLRPLGFATFVTFFHNFLHFFQRYIYRILSFRFLVVLSISSLLACMKHNVVFFTVK